MVDNIALAALVGDALEARIGIWAQTGKTLDTGRGDAEGIVVVAGTEGGESCAHYLVCNL